MTVARQVEFPGRRPLWETGRLLTDVCMGRRPADRVILGGQVVNVHTREILPADVVIAAGRVARVGPAGACVGPGTEVIDADGAYLVPGLVDTHVHVESTLVTVAPFAEAVLAKGTTTVLIENHDMANVFGADGIRWMLEESAGLPLKVLLAVPACVPPMPGLEDSGACLTPADVDGLLAEPGAAALGEMMNMQGVIDGDARMHAMIASALRRGMVATGHWSLSGWTDHRLDAYAACGVDSCHESVTAEDALAKLRAGLWVQFREGSAFHDMAALAPLLRDGVADPRHILFITDDVAPDFLLEEGHLDNAVRVAVRCGVDPVAAICAATIAPAEYLGLRHDIGSIAPGRFADILFAADLADLRPHRVLADGADVWPRPAAATPAATASRYAYPATARRSVSVPPGLTVADLRIPAEGERALVRAIGMVDRVVPTQHLHIEMPVTAGEVIAAPAAGLVKIALVSRHGREGGRPAGRPGGDGGPVASGPPGAPVTLGFVHGLGLQAGAIAQSTARDTHHLLAVGVSDADMLAAIGEVAAMQGGLAVVRGGAVLARLRLPIAGLLSDEPVAEVAAGLRAVVAAIASLGCTLEQPTTMLAMLAVSAIPELRIGNRGLIDSREFRLVPPVLGAPGSSPAGSPPRG
jgi:adenine deaminase